MTALLLQSTNIKQGTTLALETSSLPGGALQVVAFSAAPALQNFASITPAGSTATTAPVVPAMTTQLGTAASTTGVAFPAASSLTLGDSLLLLNTGTAAVHVYALGGTTIDAAAGTTGVALTNGFSCFFTPTGPASIVSGPRGTISS